MKKSLNLLLVLSWVLGTAGMAVAAEVTKTISATYLGDEDIQGNPVVNHTAFAVGQSYPLFTVTYDDESVCVHDFWDVDGSVEREVCGLPTPVAMTFWSDAVFVLSDAVNAALSNYTICPEQRATHWDHASDWLTYFNADSMYDGHWISGHWNGADMADPTNSARLDIYGFLDGICQPMQDPAVIAAREFVRLNFGLPFSVVEGTGQQFTLTVVNDLKQWGFPDQFIMDANGVPGTEGSDGATSSAQVSPGESAYIDQLPGTGTDLAYWNSSYDCNYPDGAPFDAGPGHRSEFTMPESDLTCTITNDRVRVELTLVKEAIGFDGEFCFDMIDSFGTPKRFTCISTSRGYGSLGPLNWYAGTVSFFEVINGGYILHSAICSNGDNPEAVVNLIPGSEPVTCTWVNVLPEPVPASNRWVLLLLTLMVLGIGWYYRPVNVRRR